MNRRRCPQCAERVRREALLCRFCGSELPVVSDDGNDKTVVLARTLAIFACFVVLVAGLLGFFAFRELNVKKTTDDAGQVSTAAPVATLLEAPELPRLAVGETIEWAADADFGPAKRQAGPYVLEISRRAEGEAIAPVLKISAGAQSIKVDGDLATPGMVSQISLVSNRKGSAPVIMLQGFTGGAHCCRHIQLAGFSAGKLKVVDVGQWDGDGFEVPKDISGDGIADFVMRDDRFFYAFAPYAQSYAPPQVLNVIGGKVVDVTSNPSFRSLHTKAMDMAGQDCRPGFGMAANGACPAFVAAAARVGRLDEAWVRMLGAYDASADWQLPTGCWVSDNDGCPSGQEVIYKSYPEALQAFLRKNGILPRSWLPPEQRKQRSSERIDSPRTV